MVKCNSREVDTMMELMGGLWLAGLVTWAIVGWIPGIIFLLLGLAAGSWELHHELVDRRSAASWRKNYPSYKY